MKIMSDEKPRSIMCETCGGWHTTEAHAQYEIEAREKRMAEIKARPDEAYNFDTLGFTPEEREEIEPWMHAVIKKAKHLGDDLQDSDFFIHIGPLEKWRRSPSVLTMVNQLSFQDKVDEIEASIASGSGEYKDSSYRRARTFVSEHHAGEKMESWGTPSQAIDLSEKPPIHTILELQERYVQTRSEDDLKAYQAEIEKHLQRIVGTGDNLSGTSFADEVSEASETAKLLILNLDTTDGRKKAVKFIMTQAVMSLALGGEGIGVIFKMSENISISAQDNKRLGSYWRLYRHLYHKGEEVVDIASTRNSENDQQIGIARCNLEVARKFYSEFIHGLYVPHGSVEEQRELLKRMLEMTKDHPERRLPIYNFYGKLVWPRPPEEDK